MNIYATGAFLNRCQDFDHSGYEKHTEHYEHLGPVHGGVKIFSAVEPTADPVTPWMKLKFFLKIEGYMFTRLFSKTTKEFRNSQQ